MASFAIGPEDFLLDGRSLQIVSGALHYFRVHPDQWADRIRKARLLGLNTVETYVAWNVHSPERGVFDTSGRRDLARFLDLVAAEGLHAIVRPGPYICAEWTGGGLPAWLFADPEVGVRRAEPRFLEAIGEYYAALLPIVAERQVTRGGPVLMVQVENEYGAYGDDPPVERERYLRALADMIRAQGIDVPLFTSDQANDHHLSRGSLPELLTTANFGSRATERLAILRKHQPTGPLMCMEFWDGWFDSAGLHHHTTPPEANARDLDDLLAAGASVNLYMLHGGTNFGLTSGANDKGVYRPITTSYDYDAPLSEHGAPTAKYVAMREVISRHAPVPDEVPGPAPAAPTGTVRLDRRLALSDVAGMLGTERSFDRAPTHDDVGAWDGFVLYRTRVTEDDAVLVVGEVRDRALVALDGEPVGVLDRATHTVAVPLPRRAGELTLLVEDQGRVNYGPRIGEPKGLIGPVRTATRELTGWQVRPLRFDDGDLLDARVADALRSAPPVRGDGADDVDGAPFAGPVLAHGTFDSTGGADHFLRLDGWTKGLVWVNGFCLGRHRSAGPARTLYVPGPLVRDQGNEVVVLELHAAARGVVELVPEPDLGHTEE
ncbi:beta-galactosidase family protein [Isoptericola variabilis]|uniref:Beta-galactosidase n=1 Tax=Isoptericola variabilis (strain 225) TaxID=743718 RepID=F6FUL1_ISOV2|nr:beta-galactosidase family protein [Isoptericola variabilis]AEG45438.1 glycoside hydrolase family 35 [Isoptericola variabilis 225]TWH31540.1 beta-galactosidase [Isoptericola variabilis J7]